MTKSVSILIPVKDEELGLEHLFKDFKDSGIEQIYDISFIFIIDERTSDLSKKMATNFSNDILNQKGTYGKGGAVRQAVTHWKNNINSDFVIFIDADASYSFQGVMDILDELKKNTDVASGSRFINSAGSIEGMGKLHIFGNHFLSKISSIKNRRIITDLCTGLWGFTSSSLNKINLKSKGFDLEAEIAGQCRIAKLSHKEVAISWSTRKGGTSKLKSFRDGFIILLRILRT